MALSTPHLRRLNSSDPKSLAAFFVKRVRVAPESPTADSSAVSPGHLGEEFSSKEAALLFRLRPAFWHLFKVTHHSSDYVFRDVFYGFTVSTKGSKFRVRSMVRSRERQDDFPRPASGLRPFAVLRLLAGRSKRPALGNTFELFSHQ